MLKLTLCAAPSLGSRLALAAWPSLARLMWRMGPRCSQSLKAGSLQLYSYLFLIRRPFPFSEGG